MFNRIVWASDGSDRDTQSLSIVRDLCESYNSSLRIVHVVERVPASSGPGVDVHASEERTLAVLKARTRALRRHGVDASLHVIRGSVGQTADRIAEIAEIADAQLLVVGTRGRSALTGALLGSVARRLVAVSPCPVLALPCHAADPKTGRRGTAPSISAR